MSNFCLTVFYFFRGFLQIFGILQHLLDNLSNSDKIWSSFSEICDENGIVYEDRLDARRHRRYFSQICAQHPIGTTATAPEVLGVEPIVRAIAEGAGSVLRTGLIARDFFAAFTQLTVQFPWKFGGCISRTFDVYAAMFFLTLS